MKRTTVIAAVVAFGLGGLAGALAVFGLPLPDRGGAVVPPSHPVWAEAQWPFAMDEWGKGKAFRCQAADCGAEVNLYIRAKIGFCNCTTGVSDDDELNRLSDFNLMGDKLSVLGPGHPIAVAWQEHEPARRRRGGKARHHRPAGGAGGRHPHRRSRGHRSQLARARPPHHAGGMRRRDQGRRLWLRHRAGRGHARQSRLQDLLRRRSRRGAAGARGRARAGDLCAQRAAAGDRRMPTPTSARGR